MQVVWSTGEPGLPGSCWAGDPGVSVSNGWETAGCLKPRPLSIKKNRIVPATRRVSYLLPAKQVTLSVLGHTGDHGY